MSLELNQIVINKRSGYIHTKNCEAVKQMKNENKLVIPKTAEDIKDKTPCGHCIKKRDLKEIYRKNYERRKIKLEERRKRDHDRVDMEYDHKQDKLRADYLESITGLDD